MWVEKSKLVDGVVGACLEEFLANYLVGLREIVGTFLCVPGTGYSSFSNRSPNFLKPENENGKGLTSFYRCACSKVGSLCQAALRSTCSTARASGPKRATSRKMPHRTTPCNNRYARPGPSGSCPSRTCLKLHPQTPRLTIWLLARRSAGAALSLERTPRARSYAGALSLVAPPRALDSSRSLSLSCFRCCFRSGAESRATAGR